MNANEFDFNLPEELIAQTPLKERTASRLLILDKETKEIRHQNFPVIKDYLQRGDCLVLNDTEVLPARLFGVKEDTGAKIEVLLLHVIENDTWETLVKPAKKVKLGTVITFGKGLKATCTKILEHGGRQLTFSYEGIFYEILPNSVCKRKRLCRSSNSWPPFHKRLIRRDKRNRCPHRDNHVTCWIRNFSSS